MDKLNKIIAAMTLEEKTAQMNVLSPSCALDISINQADIERLGVPGIRAVDGPRGVHLLGNCGSTCYPQPLGIAASWDPDLVGLVQAEIADELIGHGIHQIYGPGLNLIIDPRCGRNTEYFSEDPHLSGKMAMAACRAIEEKGAISTPKHFCCNSFESGRFVVDARVPERPLREVFLRAFERLIREAKPLSIMTSYNSVNGHFLSANKPLQDLLREWGFDGFVVSDWGANMEGCAVALKAGTDMEMPGHKYFTPQKFQRALDAGEITMEDIDRAVLSVLRVKERIGLLDDTVTQSSPDPARTREVMRRACAESIVLLKNEKDLLPLDFEDTSQVALIGPMADSQDMLGNQGSSTVVPGAFVSLREALESGECPTVDYDPGCEYFAYPGAEMRNDLTFEATYWNNPELQGEPVLMREEKGLCHRPFVTEEGPSLCEGVRGKAWEFSGAMAPLLPGVPEDFDPECFTLSLWCYLIDQFPAEDGAPIVAIDEGDKILVHLTSNGAFVMDGGCDFRYRAKFSCVSQRWSHLVVVKDATSLSFYLDGERVARCQPPQGFLRRPEIRLAGSPNASLSIPCRIDEVQIFDRVLSETEIGDLRAFKEIEGAILTESCEEPLLLESANLLSGVTHSVGFSARWTTRFVPERTGKHAFRITGHDGVRIRLAGELMEDAWFDQHLDGINHYMWPILEEGRAYEIEIEYKATRPNGHIDMVWCGPPERDLFVDVREKARSADVAVVCVGVQAKHYQGEAVDRSAFALTGWQDELIEAVAEANQRTVVVLSIAGGVDMRRWIDRVPSVLVCWPQGEGAGNALADVLAGKVNPGGRLPVTFPLSKDQLDTPFARPGYEDTVCAFGYPRFDAREEQVLFPFGHGLSYTQFEWLQMETSEVSEGVQVCVTVRNVGGRAGSEVVQVFIGKPDSSVERPLRRLCGFKKVPLLPGEEARAEVLVPWHELAYWDTESRNWLVEAGAYRIEVAASSRDIRLKESIMIAMRSV